MCVCCYRKHITNRSGLAGLRSATGLDLNLSNHTVGECLMLGEREHKRSMIAEAAGELLIV